MPSKTGNAGGETSGQAIEPRNRALLRELETASALTNAGHSVVLNPKISPEEISKGIRPSANPDYRIEGTLFDCYSPEPPLVTEEQSRLDVFHEYDIAVGETDYDGRNWESGLVYPSANPKLRYQDLIDDRIRSDVSDKIRKAVTQKGAARQAFGVVVNLSEVVQWVSINRLITLFSGRTVNSFIQYVIAIAPHVNALPHGSRTESVEPGQFLHLGGGARQEYRPQFEYGFFTANALHVELVFSRFGSNSLKSP